MSAGEAFQAKLVGTPVQRVEDLRLLRGRGTFVDDLHWEGMLHAAILRSSVAHGLLRSVDVRRARTMPGVHAVYTSADIVPPEGKVPTIPMRRVPVPAGMDVYEQPVIAQFKVRYVGEPVAVVIAESPALAEDALEAIDVDIEQLEAVSDWAAATKDEVNLFEGQSSNLAATYTATKGNVQSVNAPYTRREKFSVQRHTAVSMETRGLLAEWNGAANKLTVAGAAKVPFTTRRILAGCMNLPLECIDMLEFDVGGGFGVRGDFYPEDFLVPFASRKLGRPVKWIEDRRENLLGSSHARETDCEIEIGCEKDGTILFLRATIWVDIGAYVRNTVETAPRNAARYLSGPYRIENIHVQSSMVLTNKTPVGTYRGPGRYEGDFFRERMFDLAAGDLGIDVVEFRRRNLVRAQDMPYTIASMTPDYGEVKVEFDSGDYRVALERALIEIGWEEKAALRGRLIDGRYHGMAVGCFVESGGAGPKENARLVIEPDASVSLYIGSSNIGQGLETVCLQITADALSIPMERIRIFHGSTTYVSEGFGSWGSRSVVMGGSAILDAAAKLKAKMRAAAARRFNCRPDEVVLLEGLSASYEDRTISFETLAAADPLSSEGSFASSFRTFCYGAAAAHVTVDRKTGQVQVVDYVTVEDLGRIINPLTAKGQAIGAAVQGLGGTLLEHLQYDEAGQFLTASLADYLMPTATDFPSVRAVDLQISPSPHNPLGAKGGGEGGIIPVGGVIANAVACALGSLGVEPRSLPLSPDRVWALLVQ